MRIKLLLLSLSISFIGLSQNTYVPDDNFEQALIDLGYDSGPLDDYVPTANINKVTHLDIRLMNISDLTGIEDFIELSFLYCASNELTDLDISNNIELDALFCGNNKLTSLDVSNNLKLISLYCSYNYLTSLDISKNIELSRLICSYNYLTNLNVKNGNNRNFTVFYAWDNPGLSCIEVDDPVYSLENWKYEVDYQTVSFSENCHYSETYLPDDNFEQALVDLGYDTVLDDYVLTKNINEVTSLNLESKSIEDLTGVKDFNALKVLTISNNKLKELNLAKNIALTDLYCDRNSINVLDVSQNIELKVLNCSSNQLTSLNVKNGHNNNFLDFDATNNIELTCIDVDDPAYSVANWTKIDTQTAFSENCHINETYIPDDNFEQALIDLGYDSGVLDNYVVTANINNIINLNIAYRGIEDLTGIEDFNKLEEIKCNNNLLSDIDVSKNIALTELDCSNNQLSQLDVSNNVELGFLHCDSNRLNDLDIGQNKLLTSLNCQSNKLTSLDISQNTKLVRLNCSNNLLTSLNVSQNTSLGFLSCSLNRLSNLDLSQNLELIRFYCSYNLLSSIIFSQNSSLEILESSNNKLTNLDLRDCKSLKDLRCAYNKLHNLDISQSSALNTLWCHSNDLPNIDTSANISLRYFWCWSNNITSLDLRANTELTNLSCASNELISLDVSNNKELTYLSCGGNKLINLDISNNKELTDLFCGNNQLTDLDVSQNNVLNRLRVDNNHLSSLNAKNGNNTNFISFNAINNTNLTCIQVDDADYSTTNWTDVDPQTSFSEDCSTLSGEEFELLGFNMYPNPAEEVFNVTINEEAAYSLSNINGQILQKGILVIGNNTLKLSQLSNGLYFLNIKTERGVATKKLIKY